VATGNKDITLTIRAKTEGERALQSLAGVLENVLGSMGGIGSAAASSGKGLAGMVGDLAALDKAFATVAKASDTAEAAFARQNSRLTEARAQMEALKAQAASAADVIARLEKVRTASGGTLTEGRVAQLTGATSELARIQTAMTRTSSEIKKLEGGVESSLVAMQQLGSQSLAVAEAQSRVAAEVERTKTQYDAAAAAHAAFEARVKQGVQAMKQEQAAAEATARARVAAAAEGERLRSTINQNTGVTGTRASDSGATYERLAKLAAEQDAAEAAAKRAEGERLRNAIASNTGTGRPAATDSGATFSALAAREESIALRDAAAAHAMFEARVRQGVQAMREAEAAENADAAAVARLRAALDPLTATQQKYAAQLAEVRRLRAADKISAEELAAAEAHLAAEQKKTLEGMERGNANKPKISLFGLAPYETQNLFYQINDVFTQLGSGASITQTLSQQGGQIFQLFQNRIMPAISQVLPVIAGTGVALGVLALAISHAADEAERLRTLKGALDVSADGGLYDAGKLNDAAKAMKAYGVSADDAAASFKILIQEGIKQERLVEFTRTAENLAEVMGMKLPDATRQVGEAFSGGYAAIAKLDDAYNFLSESQREHIRQLFEEGRAGEGVNEGLKIFSDRMEKAANDQRGPWAEASRSLSVAWSGLLDKIANSSPITGATNAFTGLINTVTKLTNLMSGAKDFSSLKKEIENEKQTLDVYLREKAAGRGVGRSLLFNSTDDNIAEQRAKIAKLQGELDKLNAATAPGKGDPKTGTDAAKAADDRVAELDAATELQRLQDKAQKGLTANEIARRGALAGQIAYSKEILATGNATNAQKERQLATEKEIEAAKRQQADAEKRAESEAKAQNRKFAEDIKEGRRADLTGTAEKYVGMNEKSDGASLSAFFKSAAGINIDPNITKWCAAFVNAVLATNGLPMAKTPGTNTPSLAAKSFLNYGTDASSDPQKGDIVVLKGHVGFFQGFDPKGNPQVLGGNQSNGVNTKTFSKDDVLGFRRAPTAAQAEKQAEANSQAAADLNRELDAQITKRTENARLLQVEGDLTGLALLKAKEAKVIEDARLDAKKKFDDLAAKGVPVDGMDRAIRINAAGEAAGAEFRAANQKQYAQANVDELGNKRGIDALVSQRDSIQQQIEMAQKLGDFPGVQTLQGQLEGVNEQLRQMADNALKALGNLSGPDVEAARAAWMKVKAGATETRTEFMATGKSINESFASGATNAFSNFAKNVAAGKNVFKSLGDAFRQFAADFMIQIAQMILKQMIFNAISGGGAGGGGLGGAITSIFHSGGIVGGGAASKSVNPGVFAGALRYHTGGIAGLAADEVPAVLRQGEEVLTSSDPRHRNNGGAGAGGSPNIKIVNAVDGSDALNHALSQKAGEQTLLNFMRDNSQAIRAALG
jgi:uncharacterized protein (TIGR02594 family)